MTRITTREQRRSQDLRGAARMLVVALLAGVAGCAASAANRAREQDGPTRPATSGSVASASPNDAPPPSGSASAGTKVDGPGATTARFAPTSATASWIVNLVDHTAYYRIAPLDQGGVVVVGETEFGIGAKHDLFVTRLDDGGQTVWQELGVGRAVRDVAATHDTIFLSTEFTGQVNIAGGSVRATQGSTDLFVGRFSVEGKLLGGRVYATPGFDRAALLAPSPSAGGGALLAHGAFVSASPREAKKGGDVQPVVFTPQGGEDTLLSRLSPSGKLEWTQNLGTSGYDEPRAILTMPDGDVVVVGTRWQTAETEVATLEQAACEGYAMRVGPDGATRWSTSLSSLSTHTQATSITRTAEGRLLVRGSLDRPTPIGTPANDVRRGRGFLASLDDHGKVVSETIVPGATCVAPHPSGHGAIVSHHASASRETERGTATDRSGLYVETDDGKRTIVLPFEGDTVIDHCAFSKTGTLFVAGSTRPGGKLGDLTIGPPRVVRMKVPMSVYTIAFAGAVTF